jgi:hypothetical protein
LLLLLLLRCRRRCGIWSLRVIVLPLVVLVVLLPPTSAVAQLTRLTAQQQHPLGFLTLQQRATSASHFRRTPAAAAVAATAVELIGVAVAMRAHLRAFLAGLPLRGQGQAMHPAHFTHHLTAVVVYAAKVNRSTAGGTATIMIWKHHQKVAPLSRVAREELVLALVVVMVDHLDVRPPAIAVECTRQKQRCCRSTAHEHVVMWVPAMSASSFSAVAAATAALVLLCVKRARPIDGLSPQAVASAHLPQQQRATYPAVLPIRQLHLLLIVMVTIQVVHLQRRRRRQQ